MLILGVCILSSHVLMCCVNICKVRASWQVRLEQGANEVRIPGPVFLRMGCHFSYANHLPLMSSVALGYSDLVSFNKITEVYKAPALCLALGLLPGLWCGPYTQGTHSPPGERKKSTYQGSSIIQERRRTYQSSGVKRGSMEQDFAHLSRLSTSTTLFYAEFPRQT